MIDTIERLRAQGGRFTKQREVILDVLENVEGHPTADEIYALVRERAPRVHLSTIYRTLRWLEQEGRVSGRRFEDDARQERFDYSLPTEHHHFQCTDCKRVIEFETPLLATLKHQFEGEFGAQVETTSLMLYGLCSNCLGEKNRSE
jgi:Fe2+ or Zn2+ uptake regulation protein